MENWHVSNRDTSSAELQRDASCSVKLTEEMSPSHLPVHADLQISGRSAPVSVELPFAPHLTKSECVLDLCCHDEPPELWTAKCAVPSSSVGDWFPPTSAPALLCSLFAIKSKDMFLISTHARVMKR